MSAIAVVVANAQSITVGEHNGHYDNNGNPIHPSNTLSPKFSSGSPNVFVNGQPVLRKGDVGTESCSCCGGNRNVTIIGGSSTVFVNGKPIARQGDLVQHHVGGTSSITTGVSNIRVGG